VAGAKSQQAPPQGLREFQGSRGYPHPSQWQPSIGAGEGGGFREGLVAGRGPRFPPESCKRIGVPVEGVSKDGAPVEGLPVA